MHKRGRAAQPGQDVPKPAPPTPVCGPRKPGAAANSNQARIADREELGVLRELAQSLEHKLAELQATQRRVAAVATQPSNAKRDDRAVELWREIANRQIEQQVTAEAENRRLRNVMDAQNKLLAELQSQIFGRSTSKAMQLLFTPGSRVSRSLLNETADIDPAVFQELAIEVEGQYADIDRVFEDQNDYVGSNANDAHMRTDVHGHLYFQIFGRHTFPSSMYALSTAAWSRFSYSVRPNEKLLFYRRYEELDDVVGERFATEMHLDRSKAVVLVQQVKRLYRDGDRVAIVWRSRVEAVEFMDQPLTGATFQEMGYFLIETPKGAPQGYTELRTCYIIAPGVPTQAIPKDSIAFALTEFVFKWMSTTIPANHQILEDMLMFSSLGVERQSARQEIAAWFASLRFET